MPSPKAKLLSWTFQIAAVGIMGQTLLYKFSANPMSVQLFIELGMEPQGRILIGSLELVACMLLLIPWSIVYGAILGAALMVGAILGHATKLGWEGERLPLGLLAITVLLACLAILRIRFKELPMISAVLKEKPRED